MAGTKCCLRLAHAPDVLNSCRKSIQSDFGHCNICASTNWMVSLKVHGTGAFILMVFKIVLRLMDVVLECQLIFGALQQLCFCLNFSLDL